MNQPRLFVLAFPKLSPQDLAWIQAIRQAHDAQFEVVDPHFTLLFGTTAVSRADLLSHVTQQAATTSAFSLSLCAAISVKDSFSPYTHTFLVPDTGNSDLIKLHDQLYTGPLRNEQRLDIPYIPHITVGSFADPQQGQQLAERLNSENFVIDGAVDALDVVALADGELTAVQTIPLRKNEMLTLPNSQTEKDGTSPP